MGIVAKGNTTVAGFQLIFSMPFSLLLTRLLIMKLTLFSAAITMAGHPASSRTSIWFPEASSVQGSMQARRVHMREMRQACRGQHSRNKRLLKISKPRLFYVSFTRSLPVNFNHLHVPAKHALSLSVLNFRVAENHCDLVHFASETATVPTSAIAAMQSRAAADDGIF